MPLSISNHDLVNLDLVSLYPILSKKQDMLAYFKFTSFEVYWQTKLLPRHSRCQTSRTIFIILIIVYELLIPSNLCLDTMTSIPIRIYPHKQGFVGTLNVIQFNHPLGVFKGGSFEHPLGEWHLQA